MARKDVTDTQVVTACRDYCAGDGTLRFPLFILMKRTGEPEMVCFRAMERAEGRRLIEYGVSLRTAWPTEKGLALIDGCGPEK